MQTSRPGKALCPVSISIGKTAPETQKTIAAALRYLVLLGIWQIKFPGELVCIDDRRGAEDDTQAPR